MSIKPIKRKSVPKRLFIALFVNLSLSLACAGPVSSATAAATTATMDFDLTSLLSKLQSTVASPAGKKSLATLQIMSPNQFYTKVEAGLTDEPVRFGTVVLSDVARSFKVSQAELTLAGQKYSSIGALLKAGGADLEGNPLPSASDLQQYLADAAQAIKEQADSASLALTSQPGTTPGTVTNTQVCPRASGAQKAGTALQVAGFVTTLLCPECGPAGPMMSGAGSVLSQGGQATSFVAGCSNMYSVIPQSPAVQAVEAHSVHIVRP